jgi:DNA-binding response OmpR family regulator
VDILLVEDDLNLSGALSQVLVQRGFMIACCADGLEALALARRHHFDAILLDLTLPGIDGLEMLQRLRDGATSTPVMVITARGGVEDKVVGFNIGADDYLSKPFDVIELEARLRALVRRSRGDEDLRCGSLRLDRESGVFFNNLRPLDLSPREVALLTVLMRRRGQAITKEALRDAVFGAESETSTDAVELLVHRLRKRIVGTASELMTLRGVGYLLIDEAVSGRDD